MPRTKLYKAETLIALKKHWPELFSKDVRKVTAGDCRDWAARHNKHYSAPRFNGALGVVRRIFAIAVEQGYRVDNPAMSIPRRSVKPKELHLPTQDQFREMAKLIETSGAAQAKDCATLFRFLAFSGVRINEARHVLWRDVHFDNGQLHVRITKNSKERRVPLTAAFANCWKSSEPCELPNPPRSQ